MRSWNPKQQTLHWSHEIEVEYLCACARPHCEAAHGARPPHPGKNLQVMIAP
jgi:hypothetical protein